VKTAVDNIQKMMDELGIGREEARRAVIRSMVNSDESLAQQGAAYTGISYGTPIGLVTDVDGDGQNEVAATTWWTRDLSPDNPIPRDRVGNPLGLNQPLSFEEGERQLLNTYFANNTSGNPLSAFAGGMGRYALNAASPAAQQLIEIGQEMSNDFFFDLDTHLGTSDRQAHLDYVNQRIAQMEPLVAQLDPNIDAKSVIDASKQTLAVLKAAQSHMQATIGGGSAVLFQEIPGARPGWYYGGKTLWEQTGTGASGAELTGVNQLWLQDEHMDDFIRSQRNPYDDRWNYGRGSRWEIAHYHYSYTAGLELRDNPFRRNWMDWEYE
jgi:hypothetical protein